MLKLFLPVIFPSWRFFSSIGPSPRIEVGFSNNAAELPVEWGRFRPLPSALSWRDYLRRLVYNPEWNELLFINSCAERLFEGEGNESFYREEIARRLLGAINRGEISVPSNTSFLYFRIRAVYSEDASPNAMGVMKDEVFLESPAHVLPGMRVRNGN